MTLPSIVESIKTRGYWRINFQPRSDQDTAGSLTNVQRIVESSTVGMRGWDFPHWPGPQRPDDVRFLDNCIEAETSWGDLQEFWRFYTTSQFLHLKGLRTDWADEPRGIVVGRQFPENVLGIVDNTWHVAEAYQFLSRLRLAGLYASGATVSVSVRNTHGRQLYFDEVKRVPFTYERRTGAASISWDTQLSATEIAEPRERTVDAMSYIFDKFGWNASRAVIGDTVDELYTLRYGRG